VTVRERPSLIRIGLAALPVALVGGIVFLGIAVFGTRYFRASVVRWAAVVVGLMYIPMLFLVGFRPNLGYALLDPGGFRFSSLLLYSVPAETIPMSFLLATVWLWQKLLHREA